MAVQNPTLDTGELSKEIVRDLLALGLQSFADDSSTSLTDPKSSERGSNDAPFVMTSYPTSTTALYPHVIVSEENLSLEPLDRRHDVWEGEFSAGFQVEATTDTEKFAIKDGVRSYVVKNYADDTFKSAGFSDVSIDNTQATDWDENSETRGTLITTSGMVYTT